MRWAIPAWAGRWRCSTRWPASRPCWRSSGGADKPMSAVAAKPDKARDPLLAPLLAGDRRALAQALTLIESTRADHRERADALLAPGLPHARQSGRPCIPGGPGWGQS